MLAINLKPVILICMIIKEDYEENPEVINASDAMCACMEQISKILIEPMVDMDLLNEEKVETLSLIANAFKIITRKAQAYEDMQNGDLPQEFRN